MRMLMMMMLMTMMMMMNVYETKHRIINIIIILTVTIGHKKECGQHSRVVALNSANVAFAPQAPSSVTLIGPF